jgi:hypothetical protein
MSTIISYPDPISFSGNIKTFEITSSVEVVFELLFGSTLVLAEKYQPNTSNLISINIKPIVEQLIETAIPNNEEILNVASTDIVTFTATVDNLTPIIFKVIKGGVNELQETVTSFLGTHFLTWQPQEKDVLQIQPEWLKMYSGDGDGEVMIRAYYNDNSSFLDTYALLVVPETMYYINTNWGVVSSFLIGGGQSGEAVIWDIWYEIDGVRKTPIQRYRLKNDDDQEHMFVWINTLGSIDSVSFNGSSSEDEKLAHMTAIYADDSVNEFDINKGREITQNTGYLDRRESLWITDFFYSRNKYVIREDGSLKSIALVDSQIVSNTLEDSYNYEFTYRLENDTQMLNLERVYSSLTAPEGPTDFFLTELLSGLTAALYSDNLLLAVQSPFSELWQVLTMAQLWGGAFPGIVDGRTITYSNGKLRAIATSNIDSITWNQIAQYVNNILNGGTGVDVSTKLISGTVVWSSGLTYQSTVMVYKILGISYTAIVKQLTLAPADANLARIDVFYLDQFSNLLVKTGVPAVNPVSPIITSIELEVMTAYIAAGATVPSDVQLEKIYDENLALVEWETSSQTDANCTVDYNDITEPYNGAKRIKIAIAIPDTEINLPLRRIGDKGDDLGGVIFVLSDDGHSGLVSAENDTAIDVFWSQLSGCSVYSTGATGVDIGTGAANSALMLASDAAREHAIKFCSQLIIAGHNDYFLPAEMELNAMYYSRYAIGNFAAKTYWSSTENNWKRARCISFTNGSAYTRDKNNNYCVRAIRAFDDSTLPTNSPIATYAPVNIVLTFTGPGPLTVMGGILTLMLKSTVEWLPGTMLLIDSYLGDIRTGRVLISPTQTHDYNSGDENWQMVALPMYTFAPSKQAVDKFKISLAGSWPNNIDFGIDDIRYQHNNVIVPPDIVINTKHEDFAAITNIAQRAVAKQFAQEFSSVPFGRSNLKVYRVIEVEPGKLVDQDVLYYGLTITKSGFNFTIDESEDLNGIMVEYYFKEN